jgi:drug/metabolite transporter (DMT)-like permease
VFAGGIPLTPKQLGALLFLGAMWGGSFIFMRIAAPALGPVMLIELRVALAGLTLLAYGAMTRSLPSVRTQWRQYLVAGAVNSAVPFVLIATASLVLPASMTATLNATTPLFGAVIAALWIKEPMTVHKLLGLGAGLAGVAVLVGLGPVPWSVDVLLAAGASLLAAASYGVGAVYTKTRFPNADPRVLTTYSQLGAALVLAPLVPFALPHGAPSGLVIGSTLALALLCTALAYLLYFYLILEAGPTKAILVTFLSPAFGLLWSALFLGESLGLVHFVGFGLILGSVALVNRRPAAVRPSDGRTANAAGR